MSAISPGAQYIRRLSDEAYRHFSHGMPEPRERLEISGPKRLDASLEIHRIIESDGREPTPPEWLAEYLESENRARDKVAAAIPVRASAREGDNHFFESVFRPMAMEVWKAAKKAGFVSGQSPTFGYLPTTIPNAFALRVPNTNECCIIFQLGMASFLNRLIKVSAEVSVALDEKKFNSIKFEDEPVSKVRPLILETLERLPWLNDAFLNLMHSLIFNGNSDIAGPLYVSPAASMLRGALLISAERFIFAHEIGHVIGEHFSAARKAYSVSIGSENCAAIHQEHSDEFFADTMGVAILTNLVLSERKQNGPLAARDLMLTGPDVFFSSISVLTKYLKLAGCDPNSWGDTHPSPDSRRDLTRAFMESTSGDRRITFYGRLFEEIFEALSEKNERAFVSRFREGTPLSKAWCY